MPTETKPVLTDEQLPSLPEPGVHFQWDGFTFNWEPKLSLTGSGDHEYSFTADQMRDYARAAIAAAQPAGEPVAWRWEHFHVMTGVVVRVGLSETKVDPTMHALIAEDGGWLGTKVTPLYAGSPPASEQQGPTEEQWQRIGDLIEEAVRNHKLHAWQTEDGEALGMFDIFYGCHTGEIGGEAANHEIDLLVDSIFNELRDHGIQPPKG